jgi:hypothetical protein
MQDIDPRLVPIVGPDRSINMIRLGHIEHKHRTRPQTMNKVQLDVRAAILEDPLAARILTNAARIYEEHLKAQVREHGGTIVTDRSRIDADGRRTTTQTVKRYPPSRATRPTRVRSRTREHRPGATRRTSSSSTSASADPPADDSDEP